MPACQHARWQQEQEFLNISCNIWCRIFNFGIIRISIMMKMQTVPSFEPPPSAWPSINLISKANIWWYDTNSDAYKNIIFYYFFGNISYDFNWISFVVYCTMLNVFMYFLSSPMASHCIGLDIIFVQTLIIFIFLSKVSTFDKTQKISTSTCSI